MNQTRSIALAVCLAVTAASPALSQIKPQLRRNGATVTVLSYKDGRYAILENGRREDVYTSWLELAAGESFSSGFVAITNVVSDLDAIQAAPPKERAKPTATRFRFEADLTAESDLQDCFALLTLARDGALIQHPIAVGRLTAGKPKHIKAELAYSVETVGRLHIFVGGAEVRSTQVPDRYDVAAYLASLPEDSIGLPAADLLRRDTTYPFRIADDGDRLATVQVRDGSLTLLIYDLKTIEVLQALPISERGNSARDLTWVSDHEIAFITTDPRPRNYDTNLMLADLAAGKVELLLEKTSHIVKQPSRHRNLLVVRHSQQDDTLKYDLVARRVVDRDELEPGWTLFDDNGDARIRRTLNGDAWTFLYKPTAQSGWRRLDDDVNEAGLRFNFRARHSLENQCEIHSIGRDGDTLYISTRLQSDCFKLAAFSLSRGVVTQTVAEPPGYDLSRGDGGYSRLLFRKGSSELIGLIFDAEKPRIVWLDPGFARVQQVIEDAIPGHVCIPIDWTKAGNTFVFRTYSDRDPGGYYIFRPFESKLVAASLLGDNLQSKPTGRTVPWDFTSRDGATIHAYVTHPPESFAGPLPLVVNIHGGPTVRDTWGFAVTNQFLATRGYVVLQVNYRGSSGYGAAYERAGLYSRLDTVILDDIADGVRDLIAQGLVDPQRVAVMGGSFGGWATYMSLIKYPDLYRAGIAIAAIAHWRKTLRDDRWTFDNQVAFRFWQSLLDREDFDAVEPHIDPLARAAELKQPIYIMHGERDEIVHAAEARMMLEKLVKTNPHVESKSFAWAGHSNWSFADRVTQLNEIARFLRRHLGPIGSNAANEPR